MNGSRHAPERTAYAIYEHSYTNFAISTLGSFTDPANTAFLASAIKAYKIELI